MECGELLYRKKVSSKAEKGCYEINKGQKFCMDVKYSN